MRKIPTLSYSLLALAMVGAIAAGCEQRREVVVDKPGPDRQIVVERGAQGTEIEFHRAEAERHLDQAGRDLGSGAKELGQALAHGAKEVGKEVAPVAREAGQQLKEAGREVGQKVGPSLSDAAITARIKAKLLADSSMNGSDVNVDTSEGQVTLTGRVASSGQKVTAEKVALDTAGVRRVVNNLTVGG